MSFRFIENGKIDEATRKRIRSHVMRGKNVGKVRVRRPRIGEDEDAYREFIERIGVLSTPLVVGNSFSLFTFPCELQPYMRELLSQFGSASIQAVYPAEFCLPMKDTGAVWFSYLLSDEAFFHSVLAMSEVCKNAVFGRHQTSTRTLRHLSNTYRCIRKNLETHGVPSDSTVAAVMSMAIHEDLSGHPGRSKVHVEALQYIVELRGGISTFRDNQLLLQKICRADLQYALHNGAYPRFNPSTVSPVVIRSTLGQLLPREELLRIAHDTRVYDSVLRDVLIDLMSISHFFNDIRLFVRLDPYAYQEILMLASYRLLHRNPLLCEGFEDANENALYLGLLALLTTMLFQNGRSRMFTYELLTEKLRHAITSSLSSNSLNQTTCIWLLFVAGIHVFGETDWILLSPMIKTLLSRLNIYSWENARDNIKNLPWIDAVQDKLGKELWETINCERY